MATRKRTTKRTTTLNSNAKPVKRRRRTTVASRKSRNTGNFFNFLVPLVFILAILFGLGFLMFKGYQTVTASSFFDMKKVEIRGLSRVSREDVEKIIRNQTERNGVWNAELEQIKADVEKLNFVKTAVVSRILPDGVLVRVEERIPRAVVRINGGEFWVDDEAITIGTVAKNENRPPFVLVGWNDKDKTEKAQKDNKERVKLFLKMQEELKGVTSIKSIDISDLQEASVFIDYKDKSIQVKLGTENFRNRLERAMEVIERKNGDVEVLTSHGGLPFGN